MDDQQIIELFFQRSERAIVELIKKYGVMLDRIAKQILGNVQDTEECMNDVYLAVWNTIPPQKPNSLFTYICRITRNLAIKKYHSNAAKKRKNNYNAALEELGDCFASSSNVEGEIDAKETGRIINEFLAALDRDSRVLFVRRYWYSDSINDLAKLFHTNNHNISARLSRIRKKLKIYLREEGVSL